MKLFLKRISIMIGFVWLFTISPAVAIVILILLIMSNAF